MTPTDLETRLAALEARAPGGHEPPALPTARAGSPSRRSRLFAPIAMAPVLVLAVTATAVAGGAIVGGIAAQALPGAQNEGQPLEGANLECMSPPEAAAYLTDHGFTNVVWQVETGSAGDKGSGSSTQVATPPEHGYVVPGAFLGDGQLIMIVDQRDGATGVGACYGDPMP
ncbi:MAG TPA: hypothetical protein VIH00_03585 [Candidatus Limnocylindrales bacterium]